ncbi:hypothetical protein A9R01_06865 ['Osedax' symbiont bacterium Rs2_46_30_T18]|nr:hypothetical protein A9R01_06865 ['Osedax' symbiont bacterium Rs2_46_30_T18]
MKARVEKITPPVDSNICKMLAGAHYVDSHRVATEYLGRSSLQIWLEHIAKTPAWINFLMSLRNKLVSTLGLKDLGDLRISDKASWEYQTGDKVGIFTLISLTDKEVILGDNDKHLEVKISLYKDSSSGESIVISAVVHTHNIFGKIYMLFVTPVHKLIVPYMLARFR